MKEGDGKVTDIKHDDEVEKDLGVLFDTKLSFRQHIGCTVKKVNRMIGLTRRTFHYMDQEVFRLLFTSLMRPHPSKHHSMGPVPILLWLITTIKTTLLALISLNTGLVNGE